MKVCTLSGCERKHAARGLCQTHYHRWRCGGYAFDRRPERLQHGPLCLDSGPLVAAIEARLPAWQSEGRGWQSWARQHGIHPRNLYRWRRSGSVWIDVVDKVCDALGVHPCEVYGDAYYAERGAA